MKDRQVEASTLQTRIPVVSTVLHCVSMTAVVFLRSGFGYAYLRPKSVFLACSWAFVLFCIYAQDRPDTWRLYQPVCVYGLAAMSLYWLHLSVAFLSELRGTATHDNDAGTPHTLRILNLLRLQMHPELETVWVLWVEPALLAAAALAARAYDPAWIDLSAWFLITSFCLWLKEFLNYWFRIRHEKIQRGSMEDADEKMKQAIATDTTELPTSSRKPKTKHHRAS